MPGQRPPSAMPAWAQASRSLPISQACQDLGERLFLSENRGKSVILVLFCFTPLQDEGRATAHRAEDDEEMGESVLAGNASPEQV